MNFLYIKKANNRFFIILFCFIASQTFLFAQHDVLITIQKNDISVIEALQMIEKQSNMFVAYNESQLKAQKSLNLNVNNQPLNVVLAQILRGTGFTYQLKDNYIIISPEQLQQISQKQITGKVIDEFNEPVIGANVTEKGTTNGTVTDINGNFTLTVSSDAILHISYIGYLTQDIKTTGKTSFDIILQEDLQSLDELVVIGYGVQKKVNLTGAVASVKVDENLAGRSLTNAAIGLQGVLPGLAVTQSSGMAGQNDINLAIRGLGTVNNSNPLVVVDGMPDVDINRLNINDIESISVLKDAASAAVYGSRGANGVILITTRSGKDQTRNKVTVSSSYAIGKAASDVYPIMNDYARALTSHQQLEAVGRLPESFTFRNGTIDQWMAMGWIDPFLFPNTDWWDITMRDSMVRKNNASISGSTDRFVFFFSVGMVDEEGLQINNNYNLYNTRLNTEYTIRDNMKIGVRLSGNWSKWKYVYSTGFMPMSGGDIATMLTPSGITPYDPKTGLYGGAMAYNESQNAANPLGQYDLMQNHQNRQEVLPSVYFNWEPIKGLGVEFNYALNYYNQFRWNAFTPFTQYDFQHERYTSTVRVPENAPVNNYSNSGYKTQLNGKLNYHTVIKNHHDINIMGIYSEEYWYTRALSGYRYDRIHKSLHEIDAALTNNIGVSGNSSTEGLRSFVGRLNYAAYDKYLLEASFRYDASSKFIGVNQWGFFPSISLGWRFSEENFLESLKNIISNGKFRISYGELGNNSGVGRYEQKETLTTSNYIINQNVTKGFLNKKMINPDLSWETTGVTNIGLDIGFLNNRLNFELDYYDRLTSGMNRPSDLSIFLSGLYNAPRKNIGKLRNRGIETNITWNDRLKDWNYRLNFNVAYNRNRLEEWNEQLMRGSTFINMPYGFVYGYEDTGIAQSWADIYNTTPQGASPGDILLKDLNGDGRIDGNDLKAYPNYNLHRPNTNFGFNFSVSWKDIDLSGLLNGAMGRRNYWLNLFNTTSFSAGQNITWDQYNNWWSWDNRAGKFPRLGANSNSSARSTSWQDNMNYLRLKNIQLGYTLHGPLCSKLGIESIRVFGSAENLITITKYRGTDPEKQNDGNGTYDLGLDVYPLVKSYSIGININI